MQRRIDGIIESIDRGVPALYAAEECGLSVGYHKRGQNFSLRTYFDPTEMYAVLDQLGWPSPGILGEKKEAPSRLETLGRSVARAVALAHFTERWLANVAPELSGWMSIESALHAIRMPVQSAGLTYDALLFHQMLVRFVGAERWLATRRELSRVDKIRGLLEERLAGSRRSPESRFRRRAIQIREPMLLEDRPDRFNLAGERAHLETALEGYISSDNPGMVLFRATLRRFRDLGIPVQVYLNPINVDNIELVGLDRAAIERSVQDVANAVQGEGARFLDLHDIFPDDHFRDASGHFVRDAKTGAARTVGFAIGAALLDDLARDMWSQ